MKLSGFPASLLIAVLPLAQTSADEEGWVALFNGRDLSGWVNVNCAPNTFTIRDDMIVSTGIPTGVLRTERQYENFILELEWRHMVPKGNAGLFVWSDPLTARGQPFTRAIEVQILDGRNSETYTSHGDVFSIHGATLKPDRPHPGGWMRCLPSERRAKPAGQWNHYRVVCNDGVLKLAVNGEVVSGGSGCHPRKGYICLEAEGSECHFRNIRIRELPSTNATREETADVAQGFVSLYTGVDLSGWKLSHEGESDAGASTPSTLGPWRADNWRLVCAGQGEPPRTAHLWSEKEYGDFVLICDWRWTGSARRRSRAEEVDAGDSGIFLRGDQRHQISIGRGSLGAAAIADAAEPLGRWNRFVITLIGDGLTVELNGRTVVEKARLSGLPPRGRIGLEEGTRAIQFANLYVREIE